MSDKNATSNYDLYKVFLYVAKLKSLTKAAKELNVSQPAVSQSMKQLEANLGTKLTVRTGHGIRLTEAGEVLYPFVKKGIESFASGEKAVEKVIRESNNAQDVVVGASPDTISDITPAYDKENDDVIITSSSPVILDVSTDTDEVKKADNEVSYIQDCFITGVQYSHFKGQKLPYRLLEHLPIILTKDDATRENLDRYLENLSISLHTIREYDSANKVLNSVIHNEGIGCLPYDLVKPLIDTEDVYILEFEAELPPRPVK